MRGEAMRALAAYLLGDEQCSRRFQLDDHRGEQVTGGQARHRLTAAALERYVPFWVGLVPAEPTVRAELIHLLAAGDALSAVAFPRIRAALGGEEPAVQQAYRAAHGQTIEAAVAVRPGRFGQDDRHAPALSLEEQALHDAEAGLEWLNLPGGAVLMRQGDPSECLYILLSGRLRAVFARADGSEQVMTELARGEMVGEIGVLTGEPRSTSVYALRDCELLQLTRSQLIRLAEHYPQVMLRLSRVIAQRLRLRITDQQRAHGTLITIGMLPAGAGAPLAPLARQLAEALASCGPTLHLNSAMIEREFGTGTAQTPPDHSDRARRLLTWLGEQESRYRYVLYEADAVPSHWTNRCIRQADRLLIVADAWAQPEPGAVERQAQLLNATIRTELILVHPPGTRQPRGTRQWLAARQVQAHHHARLDNQRDLRRLARRVTGQAVGLVLSGGGARGHAHAGVLRALDEYGIEVDLIGGTSMGALIGGAFARDASYAEILDLMRRFSSRRRLLDPTLPLTSLFASRKVTRMLHAALGDGYIEDLWRPFFCVSSNLTRAEAMIHRDGPLWAGVRASLAIPGVYAPLLHDGDVLVDGGSINNFPLDVMRDLGEAGTVIGVNANPPSKRMERYQFGAHVSGWQVLLSRLRLWPEPVRAPSLIATLLGTMELSGTPRLKSPAFMQLADVLIQPATEQFGILDFAEYARIVEAGYRAARQELDCWQRAPAEGEALRGFGCV
jgi:NTE family protein/lysophospholipid hydrolase